MKSYFIFDVELVPKTGLLVSQGDVPIDPSLPDIAFMRTRIREYDVLYIPGSSLKGPVRSFIEGYLRSLSDNGDRKKFACLITNDPCSKNVDRKKSMEEKYKRSCLACRTFGNTLMASKVRFDDFYPFESLENIEKKMKEVEKSIVVRPGIGIDRTKGTVRRGALFFYESTMSKFYGKIYVKNPEAWQIGLIFKAADATKMGILRFGRNKSRGLGWVEMNFKRITVVSKDENNVVFSGFDGSSFTEEKVPVNKFNARKENGLIVFDGDSIDSLKEFTLKDLKEKVKRAVKV